eukprot:GHVP01036392.1.p2 GENE.GHVP01036392.1~~GHVP01036392.1.p2  ORF type:complete len:106 (-),score=1.44 GHVP01036392.1:566-883(-)
MSTSTEPTQKHCKIWSSPTSAVMSVANNRIRASPFTASMRIDDKERRSAAFRCFRVSICTSEEICAGVLVGKVNVNSISRTSKLFFNTPPQTREIVAVEVQCNAK